MNSYGRVESLATASILPATYGTGILLANHAHPVIVVGLFIISVISTVVSVSAMTRYVRNTRKK